MVSIFSELNFSSPRIATFTSIIFLLLVSVSCIKDKKSVPILLGPLKEANSDQLIDEVNRIAELKSLRGNVDIQFEDNSFSQLGLAEKYRTVDGTVIVQRPEKINLKIQAPFVGSTIAEMTSDGVHFRVVVLQGDEKYRRFVKGTNNAVYPPIKQDATKQKTTEQKTVSVLSNIRPQHFTDALLLKPIKPRSESGFFYAMSEFFQDEPDANKKNSRVMRGYYLLEEFAAQDNGTLKIIRRFWFDRVNTIRLARVQMYDDKSELVSDVVYGAMTSFGENGKMRLPVKIEVTKLKEKYKVSFTYQTPEAVELNEEYPNEAFLLENTRSLPEVDLDNRSKP
jgi:hypothetical protein